MPYEMFYEPVEQLLNITLNGKTFISITYQNKLILKTYINEYVIRPGRTMDEPDDVDIVPKYIDVIEIDNYTALQVIYWTLPLLNVIHL